MLIEIRREIGSYGGSYGHRVSIDGNDGQWHYGPADRTTISVYRRHILAHSKDGGKIVNYDTRSGKPQTTVVEGCPSGHKRAVDDFMGGTVCLDCHACW